ncbi:MAG: N-acetylglucosamine kinase [Bacteroidetes bacterium]|nr:N-acetylglucosamine kinase [Bacteroidota bacterium]MBS1671664.1 N-acetylglucosamine kinase [Bacteroidota bacterium]
MMKLIADSGATKCEWCLLYNGKKKKVITQGISPYFLTTVQIIELLQKELLPKLNKDILIKEVHFYGTGLNNNNNKKILNLALKKIFTKAIISLNTDLLAAARALCGKEKGIACILGTGSNSCFYNGKKIISNSPGIGYVLGDEGSGAYLGKKIVQYYLYNTFDDELKNSFEKMFNTNPIEILEKVYKQPLANRYLASFAIFLAENRGHYMIENIIEDGLNDFFFTHLCKYRESWLMPINFIGSVAFGFKDILKELCHSYEFELGTILKKPMDGLIKYHL